MSSARNNKKLRKAKADQTRKNEPTYGQGSQGYIALPILKWAYDERGVEGVKSMLKFYETSLISGESAKFLNELGL